MAKTQPLKKNKNIFIFFGRLLFSIVFIVYNAKQKQYEMQDEFEQSELIGRNKFEAMCNSQSWCKINKWSKNKYGHYDVSIFSGETGGRIANVIVEIKYREEYDSTDFNNWYLEETKYNNLEVLKKQIVDNCPFSKKQFNICYFNVFKDGHYKMWMLDDLNTKKQTVVRKLPRTSKGNKEFIPTNVYLMNKMEVITKGKLN